MEEQEQPSVSVKELLARMGKEESDVALGGRSRRRRPGANSVSVGDLTGEIPVVREGTAPRTHRAESAGRKWSGWSKREDPDAHLDERDREWDFRVLSGEIERVRDEDEPNGQGEAHEPEELPGGPSVYAEEPEQAETEQPEEALAAEPAEIEAQPSAYEAGEAPQGEVPPVAAEDVTTGAAAPEADEEAEPAKAAAFEEHEQGSWFTDQEQGYETPWLAESEAGGAWYGDGTSEHGERDGRPGDEHEGKSHNRVSAFKADQLERAREVLAKRKSHGQGVKRTGLVGALDKVAAIKLPAWASIALQFVVGFLVGAVLFWVFRQLWRSEHTIFAAVLAVLTIGVLVFGVRWFRRKNDWASMAVAGLVGVWVCFGPQVILLLGR